jgi:hypothetical protein
MHRRKSDDNINLIWLALAYPSGEEEGGGGVVLLVQMISS